MPSSTFLRLFFILYFFNSTKLVTMTSVQPETALVTNQQPKSSQPPPPPKVHQTHQHVEAHTERTQIGGMAICGRPFISYDSQEKLKIPAIVLSIITCCCCNWLCGGPALLLAILPECTRVTDRKSMYIAALVLSVIGIIIVIIVVIVIIVIFALAVESSKSNNVQYVYSNPYAYDIN